MIKVSEINDVDKFLMLRGKWDNLLKRNEIRNPFLSFDWFLCCYKYYLENKKLVVLVVENEDMVIGIAPFWQYKKKMRSINLRVIEFINSPDSAICDFILEPKSSADILNLIYDFILERKKDEWDIFLVNNVNSKSDNTMSFKNILDKNSSNYFVKLVSTTPYVKINKDWEQYFKNLSTKFRKSRRNIVNRIKKLSNVEIECLQTGNIEGIMKDILKVSRNSWKEKEGISICSKKETTEFFRCLTKIANNEKWLLVWFFRVDDYPIAVEYDLVCDKKVYALRADFDEEYKKYSPGAYLEYQIIKYLHENKYHEYNAGPGINKYKMNWTNSVKENISIHVCNKNVKAMVIYGLEKKLIPLLKRLRTNREKEAIPFCNKWKK